MNLYLISQDVNQGYDTYDSAVVAAVDEVSARLIHPGNFHVIHREDQVWCSFNNVKVKLIGVASEGTAAGVICASFNAG